jgi:signal transduction histidine kinase
VTRDGAAPDSDVRRGPAVWTVRGHPADAARRSIQDMRHDPGTFRPAEFLAGWTRWLALGLFAVLVGIGLLPLSPNPAVAAVAAAVAVGGGASLLWQRQRRYLLPGAAVATAGLAVLGHTTSTNLGWFAVCLIGGWCALTGGRRDALVYWAGALVLFAAEWLWIDPDPGWAAWMAGITLSVGAGLLVRRERDLVAQLREAQAGLAERARSEERNRIARELHDVIAHTLTVSLLHVTSARLAVEHDLDDAARSLAEAERLGRASLDEVRMAVGMLHQDGDAGRTSPLPGADGLPVLIEQFRSAGADAAFTVDGNVARLPATTSLALYRIVQEALTNAIKHAPGSQTAVHVAVGADEVQLAVDTAAEPRAGAGTGFGVLNMRERAQSLGGTCTAGPGGRGWLVKAVLPLNPSRRRESAT